MSDYPSFIYLLLSVCLSVYLLSTYYPSTPSAYYLCVCLSICLPIHLLLALLLWGALATHVHPQKGPSQARQQQVRVARNNPPTAARGSS